MQVAACKLGRAQLHSVAGVVGIVTCAFLHATGVVTCVPASVLTVVLPMGPNTAELVVMSAELVSPVSFTVVPLRVGCSSVCEQGKGQAECSSVCGQECSCERQ